MDHVWHNFSRLTLLALGLFLGFLSCTPKQEAKTAQPVAPVSSEASSVNKKPWGVEWERVLSGARKEGKVSVYSTSGGELRGAIVKGMKERYGLDVEWTAGRGAEISQKLLTERRAGIYAADIYLGGNTTSINVLKPAQALEPPESKLLLPEVLDPKAWWGEGLIFLDKDRQIIAVSAYPSGDFVANTNLVKEGEVASYRDMLNPKWKGKIVISDPTMEGAGLGWFTAVAFELLDLDYVRQLVKAEPVIVRDHRQLVDWLSQGKFAIGLAPKPEMVTLFQNAGAPLRSLYPKEGGYLSSGGGNVALINRALHPGSAQVFLNWILSKEGGTIYSKTMGVQSGREDVPTDHLEPGQVRQRGLKYVSHMNEDFLKLRPQHAIVSQEIFGPLMK